ncbi:oligosaccharide flippase family protein [Deinococcus sp. 14RED07]|nr:oligosaccharide flippase family protein [Deinococcus sp. 14RED07]
MKLVKSSALLWTYASFILKGFSFFMIAPIAARNLGEDEWSKVLIAQALANWMSIIVDYGYNLSYGSKSYQEGDEINEVASGIFLSRILISAFVVFLILLLGILNVFDFDIFFLISITLLSVGQGFSNTWFFQSHSRMETISKIDVLFRVISLITVYVVIKLDGPGWSIIGVVGASLIISNLFSGHLMIKTTGKLHLNIRRSLSLMRIGAGAAFFVAFTSIYTNAALVMYSFSASNREIAVYGNADRLFRAMSSLLSPLNQVIMPKSVDIIQSGGPIKLKYYARISLVYLFFSMILIIPSIIFSDAIIETLFGKDYQESSEILKYLSVGVVMISFNTVIAYHIMIVRGYIEALNIVYVATSVLFVASSIFIVRSSGIKGMVISTLLPEVVALVLLVVYVAKHRKKIL